MQAHFPDAVEILLDSNNLDDIADYVDTGVLELKNRNFPAELRKEIQEALIKGSNGMFLWVCLILYDLKTSIRTPQYDIEQKLKSLPKTLPDLYRKILLGIKLEDLEAANTMLRWVMWAERPLKLQELKIAIAIQPGLKSILELSKRIQFDFGGLNHSAE
jgi:hypothetical protein